MATLAERIVDAVIDNLTARSGFDSLWDEAGNIQEEIREDLQAAVTAELNS